MRNPFVHCVGGVLSADIAVPDHERELKFYSAILTTGDAPLWRDDLMNNEGTPVIGLGARTAEYDSLPLQWMPHFQVADVAASAASAIELGGKELMRSETNEWAVLTDQTGAAFGIIPVVTDKSESQQKNKRVGCISWLSLTVQEAKSSRDFYQKVVGWNAKAFETNQSNANESNSIIFEMQTANGTFAAEIGQLSDENVGTPPVWLIHLPVGDLNESLTKVDEFGGELIKEFPKAQFAVVRDPAGVFLALQAG